MQKREDIINSIKNNNLEFNCNECLYLEDIDFNNIKISEKIKNIEIYTWEECNCACFYCSNRHSTKLKISTKRNYKGKIDVLPYLKKLKEKNLLSDDVFISMVGGEPTLLKEFPDLLRFFIKNNCTVSVLSNGILYEKLINKLLRSNENSKIIISLDCGTKETFKKIKGVDKFDDVIKNIKRYVKDSKEAVNGVVIKYIILEGVNDNKEEIDKWVELCANLGVKRYFASIEFCNSVNNPNKSEIPDHICELYEYMKKRVKEYSPDFDIYTYDFVETFIKNNSYKIV